MNNLMSNTFKYKNRVNIITHESGLIIDTEKNELKSIVFNENHEFEEGKEYIKDLSEFVNKEFTVNYPHEIGIWVKQFAYKSRRDMNYWERTCSIRFFKAKKSTFLYNSQQITYNLNNNFLYKITLNHNDHTQETYSTIKTKYQACFINKDGEIINIDLNIPFVNINNQTFGIQTILQSISEAFKNLNLLQ